MNNNEIFASLDIGTSAIKLVLLTHISNGSLSIVGMSQVPSQGMKNGVITDLQALSNAIKLAVDDILIKTGIQVTNVIASVPATMIEMRSVSAGTNVMPDENNEKRIKESDVQNLIANLLNSRIAEQGKEIIDIVPNEFVIDQFGGIETPIGMVGALLEVKATSYMAPTMIVESMRSAINGAGLNVAQFVLAQLALSKYVLTDDQQQNGAILIDFGAGQTTLSVVLNNNLNFTTQTQKGGKLVTSDIQKVLNQTFPDLNITNLQAEEIKTSQGIADHLTIQNEQLINIVTEPNNEIKSVSNRFVSEIIEERLKEIIGEDLYSNLAKAYGSDFPRKNIVITGGASALTGLNEFVAQLFGASSTLFVPSEIGARHPGWSVSIASAYIFATQKSTDRIIKDTLMKGQNRVEFGTQDLNQQIQPEIPTFGTKNRKNKTNESGSFWQRMIQKIDKNMGY